MKRINFITGGQATIITSFNHAVHYTISNTGIVTKLIESPDIYFEYMNNGGTKTPEEFNIAIKNLIDA